MSRGATNLRTAPIVGRKVWFGPRDWTGWGWSPVSWEGWAVVAVSLAAIAVVVSEYGERRGTPAIVAIVAALGLVCWLKGTSPGSGRARAEFDRIRENGRTHNAEGLPPPDGQ